ncbi:electron transfer flavoprotein subunit alpha [Candidatus Poribacteria bacterium]|nr:electron transfer flavoprotein subunit alpha [Candidatus Poribacteria bacterium]
MKALVLMEHDGAALRRGSGAALGFARAITEDVTVLVLGEGIAAMTAEAAKFAPALAADNAALADPVADRWAHVIAEVVRTHKAELVVATATTWAKDIVGRAAGLLGGAMASDVIGHELKEGELRLRRPMFAGAIIATITLKGSPQIITVRSSVYDIPEPAATPFAIKAVAVDVAALPNDMEFEGIDRRIDERPDVTEARIVVSGGRAFKSSEDYERLVGSLADRLGAATGSSRALVDAGITPNSLQVGQTGKIVAPDLYLALGISGAVQHLAGMKNSRVIAAINQDSDAPIFEFSDFGLIGDVYEEVPRLIEQLNSSQ